jgi:hypothetical protein
MVPGCEADPVPVVDDPLAVDPVTVPFAVPVVLAVELPPARLPVVGVEPDAPVVPGRDDVVVPVPAGAVAGPPPLIPVSGTQGVGVVRVVGFVVLPGDVVPEPPGDAVPL